MEEQSLIRIRRLKIVLSLSSVYLAAAAITVLLTGSLSLLSEAGHMLADVGGIALALFAANYSRKLPTPQRTYGFYRAEILASLLNSVVLVLLSIFILYEGFRRIFEPPVIPGFPIIVVASVGLAVNFICMSILSGGGIHSVHAHQHNHSDHEIDYPYNSNNQKNKNDIKCEENLNIKAAYLETLSDTLGAAGVIVAGTVILTSNFYLADPIVSIGLAIFMLPRTWAIIKKAVHILMEGSPANVSHEQVKNDLLQIKGVTGVFELHIWTITSGMNALSAHVVVIDTNRSQLILQEVNSLLERKFGITHATIQIERYHSDPTDGRSF
ncbi:MAG TPA: cation diffusion facilitator family transporter [Nitrososphaeraceae archaeon]